MKKFFGRNKQYEEDMEWEDFAPEEDAEYYEEEAGCEGEEFYEETYEASEEEVFEEEVYEASEEEVFEEEAYEASEEEVFEEEVYEASEEEVYEDGTYEASEEEVYEDGAYEATEEEVYEEVYEASEEEEYIEDLSSEEDIYYAEDGEEEEEILAWSAMPDKNIFQKIWYSMIHMSTMDRVITTTGVLVLVLALATGAVFASARMLDKEVASFDTVGAQLDGITVIGEHGLTAVADAELAKQQAANAIEEEENGVNGEYEENEYKREVEVALNMTSIEKDLKLKFVNSSTNKLIANVPFSVTVKTPDGKTETWTDDDMDGIIYKTGITPGEYSVAMNALTDSKYAGFTISTSSKKVTVYKDIQYKKVDVSDEIKSESELAQKEDAENELEVESELVDTVAWVESTVTPGKVVWTEVPRANLNVDVSLTASAGGGIMKTAAEISVQPVLGQSALLSVTNPISQIPGETDSPDTPESTPDPTPDPTPGATPDTSGGDSESTVPVTGISLDKQTLSLTVGGEAQLTATVSPENATNKNVTWNSDNNAVAKVENGKVTALTAGTAKITATAGEQSATCTVTVTDLSITFAPNSLSIVAGSKKDVTVTINGGSAEGTIAASSSAENIAAVSPDKANGASATLTVTGKTAGTATITVTYKDGGAEKSEKLTVTVLANDSKLIDKNNNQIWKKLSEDNYVEATYADYANNSITVFYLKTETEPRYTGWQSIGGKMYYFDANGNKVTGEQVIQGAKYNFASDGSLVVGNGTFGIDVSKWNGKIDWNGVRNSGVSYVIIRCGYRGYGSGALVVDPYFEQNIKGATSAGIKVGIYFFTQAVNRAEAVEEASMVLQLVKGYTISYPIFLDVEYSGAAGNTGRADNLDVATRTEIIKAFCETIQNSGYTAGVYANKSWLTNKIDTSQLSRYKIWLAQYAAAPSYTGRYDLWQYKSTGRITGINGDVDLNLSYLGY